ncbi:MULTISPECIES: glycosyltransferase [unclassified Microbacterium]|uniref:glycosyltransferase family 2 protein n=1 Tax=unclassified Microbacterium TaxID=2609290 RepID=UPI001E598AEA|nr:MULTISPECIES: cellulose synthase catalytic subunit [unclassified Microbacterium]
MAIVLDTTTLTQQRASHESDDQIAGEARTAAPPSPESPLARVSSIADARARGDGLALRRSPPAPALDPAAPERSVPAALHPGVHPAPARPVVDAPELTAEPPLRADRRSPRTNAYDQHAAARGGPTPVMTLMVVVATIGILAYSFFLLSPEHRGDTIPYVMVIVAESILVFHALLSMWTILSGARDPRTFAYHDAAARLRGPDGRLSLSGRPVDIDVLITVYGEDLGIIRRTVTAAIAIEGRHHTWILDDGRSDDVRALAAELGARYVRRLTSHGAKAGNVNHALTLAKGDFFVVLDADFVPSPRFLLETVPFFVEEGVAFVQTPQVYGNLNTVISRGAAYMQSVFYRFVQPGRNRFNAALCVGTNVIFRRRAIDEIGGLYTDSKSEDVWTTLTLHEAGWRSVFIPDVLAIGDAPETVEAYSKQQLRWATGGFEILLRYNPLSPARRLTMDQRIQYLVTASFYLTGISPLLLLLVPPFEIYFDLRPVTMELSVGTWFLYYAGFYVMQILLAWFAVGSFKWETLTLATVSFPIYTKALVNVISGKDVGWHVTGSSSRRSPFNFVLPQMMFFVFLALTTVVAVWRDTQNETFTLATAWNATNTVILGAFLIAVSRESRWIRRQLPRDLSSLTPTMPSTNRTVVSRPGFVAIPATAPSATASSATARATPLPSTTVPSITPPPAPIPATRAEARRARAQAQLAGGGSVG